MTISRFAGQYSFLSNMQIAKVYVEDQVYRSVEHGYVASKTLDPSIRKQIAAIQSPYHAKRFGRTFALRPDWDQVKFDIMYLLVFQKFSFDGGLMTKLLDTQDQELIEGNHWNDTYWGVCNGVGQNNLGKILMDIRTHYRRLHDGKENCQSQGYGSRAD